MENFLKVIPFIRFQAERRQAWMICHSSRHWTLLSDSTRVNKSLFFSLSWRGLLTSLCKSLGLPQEEGKWRGREYWPYRAPSPHLGSWYCVFPSFHEKSEQAKRVQRSLRDSSQASANVAASSKEDQTNHAYTNFWSFFSEKQKLLHSQSSWSLLPPCRRWLRQGAHASSDIHPSLLLLKNRPRLTQSLSWTAVKPLTSLKFPSPMSCKSCGPSIQRRHLASMDPKFNSVDNNACRTDSSMRAPHLLN